MLILGLTLFILSFVIAGFYMGQTLLGIEVPDWALSAAIVAATLGMACMYLA